MNLDERRVRENVAALQSFYTEEQIRDLMERKVLR